MQDEQDESVNEHISTTRITFCRKCHRGTLVVLIDLIHDVYIQTIICSHCDRAKAE